MVEIRIEGLTKNYGKNDVLKGLSFVVKDGEFAVLLGPSGCGKSTLLRCVAGLENVNGGMIYLGNELANDIPARDRDLAMVFQSLSLFPLMTVRENIAFPLKVRGATQQAMDDRAKDVAKLLSIEDILDKRPSELSGGEQQRVAIGRAIARAPQAFLMDEPLSSLDAPLRVQLRSELKRIQKELKATILYVTHDQGEALALADKIGVINKGTLLQYDTPQNVFESPSSAFVARFVGDPQANILNVTVTRDESQKYFIEGVGFRYPIPDSIAKKALEKSKAGQAGASMGTQISIRPEDIELTNSGAADGTIRGAVIIEEPTTLYRLVSVKLAGESPKGSGGEEPVVMKVLAPKDSKAEIGQGVWLKLNMQKAHFFDRETGDLLV